MRMSSQRVWNVVLPSGIWSKFLLAVRWPEVLLVKREFITGASKLTPRELCVRFSSTFPDPTG